jgi:hypothetical protein
LASLNPSSRFRGSLTVGLLGLALAGCGDFLDFDFDGCEFPAPGSRPRCDYGFGGDGSDSVEVEITKPDPSAACESMDPDPARLSEGDRVRWRNLTETTLSLFDYDTGEPLLDEADHMITMDPGGFSAFHLVESDPADYTTTPGGMFSDAPTICGPYRLD